MTLFGWDASDFDWDRGAMDLGAAYRDGIRYFTHKATEGTSTKHRQYGEALRRARDAGVPFLGAYGVPRSSGTAAVQVDYFLSYVNAQTPWWRDFPGWFWQVDLEHWSYDAVAPARGVQWCDLLRERTGRQVLLYAPKWAYGDTIGGSDPLWQSNYGSNPAGHYRDVYPGDGSSRWGAYSGRTPVVLQYGSRTTIGTQSTCDANAFRGTEDDFARLIGRGEKLVAEDYGRAPDPHDGGTTPMRVYEMWLAEMEAGSPGYGTPSARGHRLMRIEEKLDEVVAIVPGANPDAFAAALAAAVNHPDFLAALARAVNDDAARRLAE